MKKKERELTFTMKNIQILIKSAINFWI